MTARKYPPKQAHDTLKFLPSPCPFCGTTNMCVNGGWLRKQRETAGVSQTAMARRFLYAPSYLCDVEHNRRNCPREVLRAYEELSSLSSPEPTHAIRRRMGR